MDKHSYVLMSLVVLCMLPLYCDLRSVNDRLNYDVMDGKDDNDDVLQSRKRHRIAYKQEVPVFKLPEQRLPEQKQNQRDVKPARKKVKRFNKSRRRRSNVKTRKVKSRMRPLKPPRRFVKKIKAVVVELKERNSELNKNDTKGNVSEESQKDTEKNYKAVTEGKQDVKETKSVTLSQVTEDVKTPEPQKIRIKIGDIIKEYDETEYCESIFLPKVPLDIESVLDEKENEIDDTEETQGKMKREFNEDDDYGELELRKFFSKGGKGDTEERLKNVKRDYNISHNKGKEGKDDSCVDNDSSLHQIKKSHSSNEKTKKPSKVQSKNNFFQTKNRRLVTLINHRKGRRTRNRIK